MTKQHIPKIRFKGFDDEWGESTLDTLLSYEQPTNYIVTSTDYSNEFSTPVLTAGQSFLLGYTDEEFGIKKASDENPVIIFDDFTTGSHFVNFDFKIKSSAMKLLITNNNFEPYFTFYKLRTIKYEPTAHERHWISKFSQFLVHFPSLPEQESIGQLFRTLDELISAYKENLEHYQSLKTSMLSKMFPKEGQKQPEIRLDGFEGDWEENKLSELTEEIEYGLNVSSKSFDGVNKYLRITDIDDKYRNFIEDNLTSPDVDLTSLDSYLLKVGDILFARTGASVGKSYRYKISDGKVYFAGFLIRARIKKEYDVDFVYQNTLTARYYQYIKITSQRSGQPGVNGKEYGAFKIPLPSLPEQEAIGAFFANLDETISSYQDKIGQLELLKKNLLSQMFI